MISSQAKSPQPPHLRSCPRWSTLLKRGSLPATLPVMRRDAHHRLLRDLVEAPLADSAESSLALRQALISGEEIPSELQAYVEAIQRHAHRITDEMVTGLRRQGYNEDEIFEVTVCAAMHEALRRLNIGLSLTERS